MLFGGLVECFLWERGVYGVTVGVSSAASVGYKRRGCNSLIAMSE